MVALPAVDLHQTTTPSTQKMKKTKTSAMTTLFHKMTIKTSSSKHDTQAEPAARWPPAPANLHESSEDEEEEEQELQEEAEERKRLENPPYPRAGALTKSPYSLTSGPLTSRRRTTQQQPSTTSSSCSERSRNLHLLGASDISSFMSSPSPSPPESLWEEQEQQHQSPLICPSNLHLKTLLSQLASSISASKTTFALLQASSSACASLDYVHSQAQKAMAEELQTLADLQQRLCSLSQQLDSGDSCYYKETTSGNHEPMGLNVKNLEKQEAMLRSYEGIISRFHEEIRKKDAVMEALKETLAKSMLKGEKLERRVKALEGKLSPVKPN